MFELHSNLLHTLFRILCNHCQPPNHCFFSIFPSSTEIHIAAVKFPSFLRQPLCYRWVTWLTQLSIWTLHEKVIAHQWTPLNHHMCHHDIQLMKHCGAIDKNVRQKLAAETGREIACWKSGGARDRYKNHWVTRIWGWAALMMTTTRGVQFVHGTGRGMEEEGPKKENWANMMHALGIL